MSETKKGSKKNVETLEQVTIRFAGDSGDGMQLTGHQFTDTTALVGNDLATLPDFPAEIRAPAGSLAGVSSFQIQFSSREIQTPGDHPDVLVAMNPAALKVHLSDLRSNGTIIVNAANFNKRNLQLSGWDSNPLEDGQTLVDYKLIDVDMTRLVGEALSDMGLPPKIIARSTNMFALGLLYWMYSRPMDTTIKFIETKFKSRPEIVEANKRALQAGFNFGYTTEEISTSYVVLKAKKPAGTYRNIMGNQALAMGLVAAANLNGLRLFFSGYPITPASDILHILSGYKHFRVLTFQAEDEIAAVTSTIGAAYAGALAVTATSGPGMALKSEAMGLAISAELPLVAINVQRGGPSTGMPTKTEQSDLFQAMYGRNGESPIVVLAAATPADCFNTAYEACRIAIEHMIPVILLSDGYLGSGSEPWLLPDIDALPPIKNHKVTDSNGEFYPFDFIDQEAMARGWAVPGTPALEHRIGGLEKDSRTGNVSGDYDNHQQMVDRRAQKVAVVARNIPLATIHGDDSSELLVLGWGSTYGAIRAAVDSARKQGYSVSQLHLRHLNPFPSNLGELLLRFPKIIVPEINSGQLTRIIRAEFLVDANVLSKVSGKPFFPSEIEERIIQILGEK
ncbi:MAG: 2-oxoacid:acceptor oxidoreductase subunit alpha [Candidatus Marinimicrobia bacterium]|nr:2-oxoacid:acceptor oxidoreductase subunit alpha [Candidatus Neomarinimicrobiota bacterium]